MSDSHATEASRASESQTPLSGAQSATQVAQGSYSDGYQNGLAYENARLFTELRRTLGMSESNHITGVPFTWLNALDVVNDYMSEQADLAQAIAKAARMTDTDSIRSVLLDAMGWPHRPILDGERMSGDGLEAQLLRILSYQSQGEGAVKTLEDIIRERDSHRDVESPEQENGEAEDSVAEGDDYPSYWTLDLSGSMPDVRISVSIHGDDPMTKGELFTTLANRILAQFADELRQNIPVAMEASADQALQWEAPSAT